MKKEQSMRLCGGCRSSYVMPFDLHPRCESCLGPEHASLALTSRVSCLFCLRLPQSERVRRADAFAAMAKKKAHFSYPTALPRIDGLLREPPNIIGRAAAAKQLLVPPVQLVQGQKRAAVWPFFPAVVRYQSNCMDTPKELRAPVSTYVPITKVEGFTEHVFPMVPPLDASLAAAFGVKTVTFGGRRRPVLRSPKDQQVARLADMSHQCAIQAVAAANNIALLAYYLKDLALKQEGPQAAEQAAASSAILTLSAAVVVCASRITAWQTLVHRNLWLDSWSFPEEHKKTLLEAPISPDGLFGPHFVHEFMSASQEEEDIRQYLWTDRPASHQSSTGFQPGQRRCSGNRRVVCTWSSPPAEPPRKQPRK